jgi:hypothetical protein
MDATEITIYAVLMGTGLVAMASTVRERLRRRDARERAEAVAAAAAARRTGIRQQLADGERHWGTLVEELLGTLERRGSFPQVPDDQARRYRSFATLREAARLAAADGREREDFTSRDVEAATARCAERADAARALVPSLRRAHELWSADIVATGVPGGPAEANAQSLSDQLEHLALDGGDLNLFLWAAAARLHKARVIARATRHSGHGKGLPRAQA